MLMHPHVVQFKEVFLTPKYLAIAMEFVPGGKEKIEFFFGGGGFPSFFFFFSKTPFLIRFFPLIFPSFFL